MEERGVDGRILGYDPSDPQSILEYAERLEGHTLRQMTDAEKIADSRKRKGASSQRAAMQPTLARIPSSMRTSMLS